MKKVNEREKAYQKIKEDSKHVVYESFCKRKRTIYTKATHDITYLTKGKMWLEK